MAVDHAGKPDLAKGIGVDTFLGRAVRRSQDINLFGTSRLASELRRNGPLLLAISLVFGLLIGASNSYRHWRYDASVTESALANSLILINSLQDAHDDPRVVQTALNGVAIGSGLDWLCYRTAERRWDVLRRLDSANAVAGSGVHVVSGSVETGGLIETRIAPHSFTTIDAFAVLWSGSLVFVVLFLVSVVLVPTPALDAPTSGPTGARRLHANLLRWIKRTMRLVRRKMRSAFGLRHYPSASSEQAWEVLRLRAEHANVLHDTAERVRRAERMSTMRQLVEKVSHEIRNPLAAMQATLASIQLGGDQNPEQLLRAKGRLERNIAQVESILGDLLPFSNAYQHRDVEIDIAQALHSFVHNNPSSSVKSVRAVGAPGCRVQVDSKRLKSALRNLFDNATLAIEERRRFEPELGGEIVFHCWCRGSRVVIAVDDNGAGFSDTAHDKLFDPFFSTRPNGFGLGLAIVKQFVDHYSGSVRAVDKAHGSRIEITLPCSVCHGDRV